MKLGYLFGLLGSSLAKKGPGGFSVSSTEQTCADEPCLNDGICLPSDSHNRGFFCQCKEGFTGIFCDISHPVVTCGKSSMEVNLDKRMITEHGLSAAKENIGFRGDGENCEIDEDETSFTLKIQSPFSDCGTTTIHSGDDFQYSNAVVWKKIREGLDGDEPVVTTLNIIEFKCTYEDKYNLHLDGPITPSITTVDAKTGFGDFTVDMGLFKDRTFTKPYEANPVIQIANDVCVQLELKNAVRDDLVLTVNQCWASSEPNGQGQRHELVTNRCAAEDDPTIQLIMNGMSHHSQFCFEMFKWESDMDNVYLQCDVTVCHKGTGADSCHCRPKNIDYDSYYYVNYYYANYMEELYDEYMMNGGTKDDGAVDSGDIDTVDTEGDVSATRKRRELKTSLFRKRREAAEKENLDNAFEMKINFKLAKKMTEEEIARNNEISRVGDQPGKSAFNIIKEDVLEAEIAEIEEDEDQILMWISIALIVATVALGICIGIYVQCRLKYNVQKSKIQEMKKVKEFYQGVLKPYHHPRHLPHQGQEQPPPYNPEQ